MSEPPATPDPFAPTEITGGEAIAWVTLGATFHVRGSLAPHWSGLLAAWDRFVESAAGQGVTCCRFWNDTEWKRLTAEGPRALRGTIERAAGALAHWQLEVADRPEQPRRGLGFADLHPVLGQERASWIRLRVPLDFPATTLGELAAALSETVPYLWGTAGYQTSTGLDGREAAFDQVWAWCRRYMGVDVVDPLSSAWDAARGLTGVGWLTFVGTGMLEPTLQGLSSAPVSGEVRVVKKLNGVMIQAGDVPTLGDRNRFEDTGAMAVASRLLEPVLLREPTGWPGMFEDHQSTALWTRRFLDPEAWLEASPP